MNKPPDKPFAPDRPERRTSSSTGVPASPSANKPGPGSNPFETPQVKLDHEQTVIRAIPDPPQRRSTPPPEPIETIEPVEEVNSESTRIISTADIRPPPQAAERARPASRSLSRGSIASAGDSQPAVPPMDPAMQRRLRRVIAVAAALISVVVGYYAVTTPPDGPPLPDLEMLYPYGFQGAIGPRGEIAPGAEAVEYRFRDFVPCTKNAEPDCMLYEYATPKRDFVGTMVLRKTRQGWKRISDQGMPFRVVKGTNEVEPVTEETAEDGEGQ